MSLPRSPALQQLHRLNKSSSDFHDRLCGVLYESEYGQCGQILEDDDWVWLIDYLDEVRRHVALPCSPLKQVQALDCLDPSSSASRKCLRELRTICGTRMTLPTSYSLPFPLPKSDDLPLTNGGSCDVYRVTLPGLEVCVKRVRVAQNIQQEVAKVHFFTPSFPLHTTTNGTQAFCKEAVIWKNLKHPNVLPLLGVTTTPFQLISNWVSGGNLLGYVQQHPDADQLRLVGVPSLMIVQRIIPLPAVRRHRGPPLSPFS